MQIANQLSTEIHDGVYRRSQMLPTEREIMERFSVSRQTVRQALSILVTDGLIEKRQGSGSHILEPQATRQNKGVAIVTTYINDYIFPTILRDVENVLSRKNYATMIFATENKVGGERDVLTALLRRPLVGRRGAG
ncbi:MAG: GntR family transcriptional regulator, partial [Clostridiales bacterium]|nr:GntR family transcriptional regulator [Clostridiales bacterium]